MKTDLHAFYKKMEAVVVRAYEDDERPTSIIDALDTLAYAIEKCDEDPRIAKKFYETLKHYESTIADGLSPSEWIINNKVRIILRGKSIPVDVLAQSHSDDTERLQDLRQEMAVAFVKVLMVCLGDVKGVSKPEQEALRKKLSFGGLVSMDADDALNNAIDNMAKFIPTKQGHNLAEAVKPLLNTVKGSKGNITGAFSAIPSMLGDVARAVDLPVVTEMMKSQGVDIEELAAQFETNN